MLQIIDMGIISSSTERAAAIRAAASAAGARIAFVSGNFNIVHPGHLRLLKFAADAADILVVGLTPDATPGVSVPGPMRLDGIRALSIVHHAFLLDGDISEFIAQLRPDFVVKGKEFEDAFNPEVAIVNTYGGKLIFTSGDVQFASMELLRQEFSPAKLLPLLRGAEGFPERHRLTTGALHGLLDKMSGIRVAVIGDIIVDDYITCDPLGMSHEDPSIVVSPLETQTFVGGAGIVSAHARSLGAEATFFTVFGDDDTASVARNTLETLDVKVHGIIDETRPTTRKQRYRALEKTLLRVSHLRQHAISKQLVEKMFNEVAAKLHQVDLLMFSDFNYGCLPQELVEAISEEARSHGVMLTADSQASSQMGDIARFKRMTLVTPTEREARLALRDNASGLAVLAADLRKNAAAENVLITLGEDGMMVHGRLHNGEYMTDRLPALNATPKDVAGAGDSLLTAASMALCAGADIWLSSYLGGIAAALQVSRIGNEPLKRQDILSEIDQIKHP
jgi:rfaE bifunctional protein kinase chain/domain